jgi:hypothetical protein
VRKFCIVGLIIYLSADRYCCGEGREEKGVNAIPEANKAADL